MPQVVIGDVAAVKKLELLHRKVEGLAREVGFTGLGALGVPEEDLDEIAEATAERAGAKANPRPATPAQIAELLRGLW